MNHDDAMKVLQRVRVTVESIIERLIRISKGKPSETGGSIGPCSVRELDLGHSKGRSKDLIYFVFDLRREGSEDLRRFLLKHGKRGWKKLLEKKCFGLTKVATRC